MLRLSLWWAAGSRILVAVGCGGLGLLLLSGSRLSAAALVTGVLVVWTLVFCGRMLRLPGVEGAVGPGWLTVDLAVTCAVLLSQHWTIAPDGVADGTGWMNALVSMTIVTYQWHTRAGTGALATLVLTAAYWIGVETSIGGDDGTWPAPAFWLLADGLLSRGLYVMVRRGGRRADAYLQVRDRKRADAEVRRLRRADEREYLATLHDTAASTLLMVGQGTVSASSDWLCAQAARDLRTLDPRLRESAPAPTLDLATLLVGSTAAGGVAVSYRPPPTLIMPSAAALAIADSVREALTNVARHSGAERAHLRVDRTGDRVRVEIIDRGTGFDPDQVPPGRRGITESIVARMRRAGGRAQVRSAPGEGTVVGLEWAGPWPQEPADD